MIKDKIITDHSVLAKIIADLKINQNRISVFTNGCFDILHPGHVQYLEQARQLGDILIIAINTDESVSKLKGPHRPIQTQFDRAIVLSALESVSYVTFFSDDTPLHLIKLLMPDVLVKGGDWKVEEIVGAKEVKANGGTIKSILFIEGQSTSNIEDKILSKNKNI